MPTYSISRRVQVNGGMARQTVSYPPNALETWLAWIRRQPLNPLAAQVNSELIFGKPEVLLVTRWLLAGDRDTLAAAVLLPYLEGLETDWIETARNFYAERFARTVYTWYAQDQRLEEALSRARIYVRRYPGTPRFRDMEQLVADLPERIAATYPPAPTSWRSSMDRMTLKEQVVFLCDRIAETYAFRPDPPPRSMFPIDYDSPGDTRMELIRTYFRRFGPEDLSLIAPYLLDDRLTGWVTYSGIHRVSDFMVEVITDILGRTVFQPGTWSARPLEERREMMVEILGQGGSGR